MKNKIYKLIFENKGYCLDERLLRTFASQVGPSEFPCEDCGYLEGNGCCFYFNPRLKWNPLHPNFSCVFLEEELTKHLKKGFFDDQIFLSVVK